MSYVRGLRAVWPLVGAAASWGVATVISKSALAEFDPLALLPIQLAVSVIFLRLVVRVRREPIVWSAGMRRLALLGVLNPGVSYALSLAGLALITASLSVLLWAAEPIVILLLAVVILHDRVTLPLAALMGLACVGVLLIVQQGGSGGAGLGVLLTLVGVVCCAVYTVLCRKGLVDDAALPVVLVQQSAALCLAAVLALVAALLGRLDPPTDVSITAWASAVGSGVLYYAVAFWFYLNGLRQVPAAVAGAFINLIPVFGIAAGYVVLQERLTTRQWIGAVVVLVAVTSLALLPQGRSGSAGDPRPASLDAGM